MVNEYIAVPDKPPAAMASAVMNILDSLEEMPYGIYDVLHARILLNVEHDCILREETKYRIGAPVDRLQSVEKVSSNVEVYQFALHQSLPCAKGGGAAQAASEGLCSGMLRICIRLRRKGNILPRQSLSHAARVTAPFAQGSLGRSRARGFIDSLRLVEKMHQISRQIKSKKENEDYGHQSEN